MNMMGHNCKPFPFGCDIDPTNPISVLEAVRPPVDIPYCQRIACNPSQPVFELDRTSCLKNPGCYYDDELATLRSFFGEQILPGVPVCHLVVRNRHFHNAVKNERMMDGSSFNGLYTKCWLKRNELPLNEGCYVNEALKFFNYPSQKAGWEGITKEECNLLGHCPTEDGCVVAGNVKSMVTRSMALETPQLNERFGQPMCQQYEFDASKPEGYLSSYSMCMASGCAVTGDVNAVTLKNAMYNYVVASELSMLHKYRAVGMIASGEMQPHNYKDKISKLRNSCGNSWLSQQGGDSGGLSSLISGMSTFNNPFVNQNNQNPLGAYSLNLDGKTNSGPEEDSVSEATGKQFNVMNLFGGNSNPNPFANNLQGPDLGMLGNLGGSNAGAFGNQNILNSILGLNQGGANNLNSIFGGSFGPNPLTNFNNLGCPYSSPTFGNYPALKGKFTGCCKRHQCYYPRSAIHMQHSGVASYYGGWTSWSKCSATCGGGRQERRRDCVSLNGQPCDVTVSKVEEKICNDQQCPQITSWGSWSLCSATCGKGVQERYRSCVPAGSCPNEKVQEQQECSAPSECPVFGEWEQFGRCDSSCGRGTKTRQRACLKNCLNVTAEELIQSESCYTINGKVVESAIGSCGWNTKCSQTVDRKCVKSDGSEGCCGEEVEEKAQVRCSGPCSAFCARSVYKRYCHQVWH